MSNSFIMTESIVRPAKMPYGRLKDNGFVGIEGEHAARALVVETKDDLSAFASINLIIDDLDCGAMTKTTSGNTTTLSMTLTSSMIGRSGRKICQLIMVNSGNTVVQKSSQFEAYVGRANEIERSVDDGVTIIILSEAVTEMAREAAAAAAEEAAAGIVDECQDIADAASASADAAAQSASDAQTAAASITVDATLDPTSTHAIQNKAVASEISAIKADLGALDNKVLSDDLKNALMACFDGVAWKDGNSTNAYDDLCRLLEYGSWDYEWSHADGLPDNNGMSLTNKSGTITLNSNGLLVETQNSSSSSVIYRYMDIGNLKTKTIAELKFIVNSYTELAGGGVRLIAGLGGNDETCRYIATVLFAHDGIRYLSGSEWVMLHSENYLTNKEYTLRIVQSYEGADIYVNREHVGTVTVFTEKGVYPHFTNHRGTSALFKSFKLTMMA